MEQQKLDQATIEEIKRRLVKVYNPLEIYLLEPQRGDTIDVNLLVIVEGENIPHYDLMTAGHKALIGVKVAKNILVYTPEEFEEYSQDQSTLSYAVKNYGERIYARA